MKHKKNAAKSGVFGSVLVFVRGQFYFSLAQELSHKPIELFEAITSRLNKACLFYLWKLIKHL